jgi:hypothetical protein
LILILRHFSRQAREPFFQPLAQLDPFRKELLIGNPKATDRPGGVPVTQDVDCAVDQFLDRIWRFWRSTAAGTVRIRNRVKGLLDGFAQIIT